MKDNKKSRLLAFANFVFTVANVLSGLGFIVFGWLGQELAFKNPTDVEYTFVHFTLWTGIVIVILSFYYILKASLKFGFILISMNTILSVMWIYIISDVDMPFVLLCYLVLALPSFLLQINLRFRFYFMNYSFK